VLQGKDTPHRTSLVIRCDSKKAVFYFCLLVGGSVRRVFLALLSIAPLLFASGCSLREPRYSPELGGFPIYRGSHSDRARLYHGVDYREGHKQVKRKPEQSASVSPSDASQYHQF
jgi:hypothetical protein